jgi:hypothetical protein
MDQKKPAISLILPFISGVALTAIAFTLLLVYRGIPLLAQPTAIATPISTATTDTSQTIEVPANRNGGTVFTANYTGTYTFEYLDSAFAPMAGDVTLFAWSTLVIAFPGSQPYWLGNDLNYQKSVFVIGSGGHPTKQDAIATTVGESVTVTLNANDQIVLVVGDSRDCYADNSGVIKFRVHFSP